MKFIIEQDGNAVGELDYDFSYDLLARFEALCHARGYTTKAIVKGSFASVGYTNGVSVRKGGSVIILRAQRWVETGFIRGRENAQSFAIYTGGGKGTLVRTLKAFTPEDAIFKFVSARQEVARVQLKVTVDKTARKFTINGDTFALLLKDEVWASGSAFGPRR